jgi:hypothetical protein
MGRCVLDICKINSCYLIVKNEPEGIYGPDDNEGLQSVLDELYGIAVDVVERKLIALKIEIPQEFRDHLINIGAIES